MSKKSPQTATKSTEIRPKKPKIPAFGRKSRKPCLNLREYEAKAVMGWLLHGPYDTPAACRHQLPKLEAVHKI